MLSECKRPTASRTEAGYLAENGQSRFGAEAVGELAATVSAVGLCSIVTVTTSNTLSMFTSCPRMTLPSPDSWMCCRVWSSVTRLASGAHASAMRRTSLID